MELPLTVSLQFLKHLLESRDINCNAYVPVLLIYAGNARKIR